MAQIPNRVITSDKQKCSRYITNFLKKTNKQTKYIYIKAVKGKPIILRADLKRFKSKMALWEDTEFTSPHN